MCYNVEVAFTVINYLFILSTYGVFVERLILRVMYISLFVYLYFRVLLGSQEYFTYTTPAASLMSGGNRDLSQGKQRLSVGYRHLLTCGRGGGQRPH